MNEKNDIKLYKNFPLYGWLGIVLIIIFWILNWSLSGLRTQWGFFPLWIGYSLTVDALTFKRKRTSLLTRNIKKYILLFLISAPVWWLFEMLNTFTHNWYYDGKEYFSDLEYFLLASLSFSTVIPAVFGSAELISTLSIMNKKISGPIINPDGFTPRLFFTMGIILLFFIIILPEFFYPFIWISVYLLIEPLNLKLKRKTILDYTKDGNWQPILSLFLGCLICAFFWEMWNYFSYPKWIYDLPYFNRWYIFEMPLPGYLGYLPFSIELYAIYYLFTNDSDYLQIEKAR